MDYFTLFKLVNVKYSSHCYQKLVLLCQTVVENIAPQEPILDDFV